MITNINEFVEKFEKGQIKIVEGIYVENFDDMDMEMDDMEMDDMEMDDMEMDMDEDDLNTEMTDDNDIVEEKPVVTLDTLKDALLNKFNTDEEGQESIMLSDEQLQVVYDTLIELGVVSNEEVKPEGEELEEVEDVEELEEGFGKFLKDKINKAVAEDDESIQQRRTALINRIAKLAGKDVYVQIAKQPETLTSLKEFSVEDVVDKVGKADTYNGKFLKPIVDKTGKTIISYTPGASGFLGKAGAAVSGLTTGK